MIPKEAIILAGGMGTRLAGVISNIPKPMAPIQEKPFLEYLLNYINSYGIKRVVLSVGYKYEIIQNYFGNEFKGMQLVYCIETEPLGTGGGIAKALSMCNEEMVFILNGDTFFNVNLNKLYELHASTGALLSFSLKPMQNVDRYGRVEVKGKRIAGFHEKEFMEKGLINGGVYCIWKYIFNTHELPEKFSFETDFINQNYNTLFFGAFKSNTYFIDIGIPEDYKKAQDELSVFKIS